MIRIQYTAARDMTGDHVAGTSVTLSFSPSELTPGTKATRTVQKSLSGRRETVLQNSLQNWSVVTGPLEAQDLDVMQEFLASVCGGESFTFEPWRYETGPSLDLDFVTPRLRMAEATTCVLDVESWQLTRLIGIGTGGADDCYQVSFTVEATP